MWFWWFILACDLMVPMLMVGAGNMMWKHAPEKINAIVGYRTTRSMKNIDTWNFAQEYCGRLWWKIGWIMLIPSFIIQLPFYHSSEDVLGIVSTILVTIQCLILFISIIPTERALKRTFAEDGTRKKEKGQTTV